MEIRLIPDGEKITLAELPAGTIFAFGQDCLAVKSEYQASNGLIEAFIIDSGELFWGGAKTVKEQHELLVQPMALEEVVQCKHCQHWAHMEDSMGDCTNGRFHIPNVAAPTMHADDSCCLGERRKPDA